MTPADRLRAALARALHDHRAALFEEAGNVRSCDGIAAAVLALLLADPDFEAALAEALRQEGFYHVGEVGHGERYDVARAVIERLRGA